MKLNPIKFERRTERIPGMFLFVFCSHKFSTLFCVFLARLFRRNIKTIFYGKIVVRWRWCNDQGCSRMWNVLWPPGFLFTFTTQFRTALRHNGARTATLTLRSLIEFQAKQMRKRCSLNDVDKSRRLCSACSSSSSRANKVHRHDIMKQAAREKNCLFSA